MNIENFSLLKPFGVCFDESLEHCVNDAKTLRGLLSRHGVLIFKKHHISTAEELVQCAQQIGECLAWDFGLVNELKVDANAKNYLYSHETVPFHWDGAFFKEPQILMFHCIKADGGETLFTDTTKIYDALSTQQKCIWQSAVLTYKTEKLAHYGGEITGAMIREHPVTQQKIIRYAEPVQTKLNPVTCCVTQGEIDAESLHQEMSKLLRDQRYCYSHRWESNDILLADNFSLLHARTALPQKSQRHIRRVQIL